MKDEILTHKISYISANCNRKPHAFDIRENYIVYPSCQTICIYDFATLKHLQLINGHSQQVNCTRWINSVDSFVSSSLDGSAIIWSKTLDEQFNQQIKCYGPEEGLLAVDCIVSPFQTDQPSLSTFLTCASSNSESLILWTNEKLVASIQVDQFVFDIKLVQDSVLFGRDTVLIAFVGNDTFVHLLSFNNKYEAKKLMKLSGHEDWVQSVDVTIIGSDTLYLASGSQDNFIRVWKISRINSSKSERGRTFSLEDSNYYEVEIETVLLGHEGWVYSVQFQVNQDSGQLSLLSSSMDKSIVLWQQPTKGDEEIWTESVRVGDVGGSALGFVGALITHDQTKIIGQSFNGTIHFWHRCTDTNSWSPGIGFGGHWECVTDLCWEPKGRFLLTCSFDQTTRLHAPWTRNSLNDSEVTWHEMTRPQIHGYDLNCLTVIDGLTFASGAEEKVIRIFGGTKSFVQSLQNVSEIDCSSDLKIKRDLPECASVPPLGLSNKAIYSEIDMDEYFKSVILEKPPLEEILQQNTLWPEIQKLYGHNYEIFIITCNHEGTLLASACKANKTESAHVTLWNIRDDFKKISDLHFHNLTITQLRFSPNDQYLISVSRDRTWCLYEIKQINEKTVVNKIASTDKKSSLHNRIIWDVSWSPDNDFFITCSRDKKAIVWSLNNPSESNIVNAVSTLTLSEAITTIDIAKLADSYLVALGLETGIILIYQWSRKTEWTLKLTLNNCHTSSIKRIRFQPGSNKLDNLTFASCGDDRKVIIHKVDVN